VESSVSSSAVADALDRMGLQGVLQGFASYTTHAALGTAFTVCLCDPSESSRGFSSYLEEVPSGALLVIDNAGRRGHSVFGGLMSAEAHRKGVVGAVVNGEVRDAAEAEELGFAIFARGRTPRSGRAVARVRSTNDPVTLGDVTIKPGDTVVADADGIVVVPAGHAEEALVLARFIEAADAAVFQRVRSGVPLSVARDDKDAGTTSAVAARGGVEGAS
jgi:regulator of RNase E activity RraA